MFSHLINTIYLFNFTRNKMNLNFREDFSFLEDS